MSEAGAGGLALLLAGLACMVGSGLVALVLGRRPRVAGAVAAGGAVVGALLGLGPVLAALGGAPASLLEVRWAVPGGALAVGLDPLSAFFLLPALALGGLAAVYGVPYLLGGAGGRDLGPPFFGFNLLLACIALALVARNMVVLLMAWETMAVCAALLVAWEHQQLEVRRAGWVYLVAAHVGAAALFLLFLVLKGEAGSFSFAAAAAHPPAGEATVAVVLALTLVGFGSKAGLAPFHVWLPEAHAAAPSHVSAMLSGVVVNLGLYGLIRMPLLLGPPPAWWGAVLAALGLGSALLGIALAISQRDLKRALAYSTVENVGLIVLALGVSSWAAGHELPRVAALCLAGALLHTWNHVLMKGGMFLVAGSVVHGAGTRDLERLGGLARRMPFTAAGMTVGALALSALPPFNGFVSEFLVYLGLMRLGTDAGGSPLALLLVGGVALVGALAALSFVRLFGVVLLGQPRSPGAAAAHESGPWMLGPLLALSGLCVAVAVAPSWTLGALEAVRAQVLGPALAPLHPADAASLATVGVLDLALWALGLASGLAFLWLLRRRPVAAAETWGCGYAAPTARMQYGGGAFAELAVGQLPGSLRPPVAQARPTGLFPGPASLELDHQDPVTRGVYEPAFLRFAGRMSSLAWVQRGLLHSYLSYVLLALLGALVWVTLGTRGPP